MSSWAEWVSCEIEREDVTYRITDTPRSASGCVLVAYVSDNGHWLITDLATGSFVGVFDHNPSNDEINDEMQRQGVEVVGY